MRFQTMNMLCAAHDKKGERVIEINVNPKLYENFSKKEFTYKNKTIPIVSKGWKEVDGYYYRELSTSEGNIVIREMFYTIQ